MPVRAVICAILLLGIPATALADPATGGNFLPPVQSVRQTPTGLEVRFWAEKLTVDAVQPNILRFRFVPAGAAEVDTLVLDPARPRAAAPGPDVSVAGEVMELRTPALTLQMTRGPFRFRLLDGAGRLLVGEPESGGIHAGGVRLEFEKGSPVYGIGGFDVFEDPSAGMVRTGEWVVQAGKQGDSGAPFAFTTRWGLLVDSDGGRFRVDDGGLVFTGASTPDLEFFLVVGPPKEQMRALRLLTGASPMFPKWTLGFMNSEWGTDEKEVLDIVERYRAEKLPLDVFILDFDWKAWGEDDYGEWRWNSTSGVGAFAPDRFPNGASGQFARRLRDRGVKLAGIFKPRILLQGPDGTPHAAAVWAERNGCWVTGQEPYPEYFSGRLARDVDFGKAPCRSWFFEHARPAVEAGITGTWHDEEDTAGDFFLFANFQGANMQRAFYEGQRAAGNRRAWSLNRNFYLGAQRYAYAIWSGDIGSEFETMARQRARMLSALNTGIARWGMDIGGFWGTPTPAVYARWMQFGAFVPIYRVHGARDQQRQPWVHGEKAAAVARAALDWRYRFIPYLYACERQLHETGVGLVRPLFWEWPGDPALANRTDAWMLGDFLLAAPIVTETQEGTFLVLPAGDWIDYFSGERVAGGRRIERRAGTGDLADVPLYVREGAILPVQAPQGFVGESPVAEVDFEIFPSAADTRFAFYDDDGETYDYEKGAYFRQVLRVRRDRGTISVKLEAAEGSYPSGPRSYHLRIHASGVKAVRGGSKELRKASSCGVVGEGAWCLGEDRFGPYASVRVPAGKAQEIVLSR